MATVDITNAARTALMRIDDCCWDSDLVSLWMGHPTAQLMLCLPSIRSCAEDFGHIHSSVAPICADDITEDQQCLLKAVVGVPITGLMGDQHASCVGQRLCNFRDIKCTYGTGAFVLMNTGETRVRSRKGLLTTPCYKLGRDAPLIWALEGCIQVAGSGVSWLRDNLGIIQSSEETEGILGRVDSSQGVVFVPALGGLYSPYWRADARGCIMGLTQYSGKDHIARAMLEAVAFQIYEVLEAFAIDMSECGGCAQHNSEGNTKLTSATSTTRCSPSIQLQDVFPAGIKVDGGMCKNRHLMQLTADVLGLSIKRPDDVEVTSLGAAMAAAIGSGLLSESLIMSEGKNILPMDVSSPPVNLTTRTDPGVTVWSPQLSQEERDKRLSLWREGVMRSFNWPRL
eukprot:GHVQ01019606.1.p1 GENE.GHVQ01019606.1~~GHVQ01019606.1.p1  ORF type:complete len:398 (-),score=57.62 GHVQ01019606.1:85-1278(-)